MEIFPEGYITAEIPKYQDSFVWNKVTTVVNNVLVGTKWIDHFGEMIVVNRNTGDKCKITFEKTGWFNSANGKVEGIVYNRLNSPSYKIEGSWMSSLKCTPYEDGELQISKQFVIWEKDPMPEWAGDQFNFTAFAMQINELADYMRPVLPRTDSRWRPDQRAFEDGDVDLAQKEKERLEEAQRERRRITSQDEWEPRWFTKDGQYKGNYWEQRLSGNWTVEIPNIYEMELDRGRPVPSGNPSGLGQPTLSLPSITMSHFDTTITSGSSTGTPQDNRVSKRRVAHTEPGSHVPTTGTSTTPMHTKKHRATTMSDDDGEVEDSQTTTTTSLATSSGTPSGRPRSSSDGGKKDTKKKLKKSQNDFDPNTVSINQNSQSANLQPISGNSSAAPFNRGSTSKKVEKQ